MSNRKYDIYERIFLLAVGVIRITKVVPKSEENKVIISWLLRSVTSMGANAEEADGVSLKESPLKHIKSVVEFSCQNDLI